MEPCKIRKGITDSLKFIDELDQTLAYQNAEMERKAKAKFQEMRELLNEALIAYDESGETEKENVGCSE